MADLPSKEDLAAAGVTLDPLRGLESVTQAARDLAESLRRGTIVAGNLAERELSIVIGLAETIRDQTVSEPLLKRARAVPVVRGLRVSSHRALDLGFDALGVSLTLGSGAVDAFLSAPRGAEKVA
jgi:hypothetical protein